jgi:hypothetical protein
MVAARDGVGLVRAFAWKTCEIGRGPGARTRPRRPPQRHVAWAQCGVRKTVGLDSANHGALPGHQP